MATSPERDKSPIIAESENELPIKFMNDVINRFATEFKTKPVGPVGNHILIEECYKSVVWDKVGDVFLNMVIFGDESDRVLLRKRCKESGITTDFPSAVVPDVTNEPCHAGSFESLCVISSRLIKSFLRLTIDSHRTTIDDIIYSEDYGCSTDVMPLDWVVGFPKVVETMSCQSNSCAVLESRCTSAAVLLELVVNRTDLIQSLGLMGNVMPTFPPDFDTKGSVLFVVQANEFDENLFTDGLAPWTREAKKADPDTHTPAEPAIKPKLDVKKVIATDYGYSIARKDDVADTEVEFCVMRGTLPRDERLQKRIAYLRETKCVAGTKNHRMKSALLIMYDFMEPGEKIGWISHGNSETVKPWYRSHPRMIRQLKSELSTAPPRVARVNVQKNYTIPISKDKLQYAARGVKRKKAPTGPVAATDYEGLLMSIDSAGMKGFREEYHDDPFGDCDSTRSRVLAYNPVLLESFGQTCPTTSRLEKDWEIVEELKGLSDKELMSRLGKEMENHKVRGGKAATDTTFTMGDMFVTPVMYSEIRLRDAKSGAVPTLPFAFMFHHTKRSEDYKWLADKVSDLIQHVSHNRSVRSLLTDADRAFDNMKQAIAFRKAERVLCSLHLEGNAGELSPDERAGLFRDLFGNTEVDSEGLHRRGGLLFTLHKDRFLRDLARYANTRWTDRQKDWISGREESLWDHYSLYAVLRAGYDPAKRVTTNGMECLNKNIKSGRRKECMNEVVANLGVYMTGILDEIRRALVNEGEWRCAGKNPMNFYEYDQMTHDERMQHARLYGFDRLVSCIPLFARGFPEQLLRGVAGSRMSHYALKTRESRVLISSEHEWVVREVEKNDEENKVIISRVTEVDQLLHCERCSKNGKNQAEKFQWCYHKMAVALRLDHFDLLVDVFLRYRDGETSNSRLRRTRNPVAGKKPFHRRKGKNSSAIPTRKAYKTLRRSLCLSEDDEQSFSRDAEKSASASRRRSYSFNDATGRLRDEDEPENTFGDRPNWDHGISPLSFSPQHHEKDVTSDEFDVNDSGTAEVEVVSHVSPQLQHRSSSMNSSSYAPYNVYTDCDSITRHNLRGYYDEDGWVYPRRLCRSPSEQASWSMTPLNFDSSRLSNNDQMDVVDASLSEPVITESKSGASTDSEVKHHHLNERPLGDMTNSRSCKRNSEDIQEYVVRKQSNRFGRATEFAQPIDFKKGHFTMWQQTVGLRNVSLRAVMIEALGNLRPASTAAWMLNWTKEYVNPRCEGCQLSICDSGRRHGPDNILICDENGSLYHSRLMCIAGTGFHPSTLNCENVTHKLAGIYKEWLRYVLLLEI